MKRHKHLILAPKQLRKVTCWELRLSQNPNETDRQTDTSTYTTPDSSARGTAQ